MTDQAKVLKAKRGVIKGTVTRFENYLKTLNSTNIDTLELQDRRSNFQPTLSQFNEIQEEIELLENCETPEISSEERVKFESQYYSLNSKAGKLCAENATSRSSMTSGCSNTTQPQQLRLPEINLPNFSGNYEDWYNFYNTFDSVIKSNANLSKIQKLHYLKSLLRGEASEVLASLEISEDNYDCAWDLLKARYDNKRIIINKHIQAILNLPAMTRENCLALRKIVDGVIKHIRILKSLGRPVDTWDDIIIYTISTKLDSNTVKEWESSLDQNVIPSLECLTSFLSKKCNILEAIGGASQITNSGNKGHPTNSKYHKPSVAAHITTNKFACAFCDGQHSIYRCFKFTNLSARQRIKEVESKGLCKNCLRKGHQSDSCNSGSCRTCHKRHNTLLHISDSPTIKPAEGEKPIEALHVSSISKPTQILLATVIIDVCDATGHNQRCRALLDSGSQSCFITETFANQLKLPRTSINIPVTGISNMRSEILSKVNITFKSRYNSFKKNIDCLILKRITGFLPSNAIDISKVNIPHNIQLADPHFHEASSVDLLIGAEVFWDLLFASQIKLGKTQPTFQKTQLGWIISGQVPTKTSGVSTICNLAVDAQINARLTQFWNIEEYSVKPQLSFEEKLCEEHFSSTASRNDEGRFIVQIPLKENALQSLGNSRTSAEKRLFSLERKFNKDPDFKKQYTAVIHEFLSLNHMKLAPPDTDKNPEFPTYYLPHHAVTKQTSLTTKLRVVFDGSAQSANGVSLNDIQMTGPTLQQDLLSIVMRFRIHKFVMTADIEKMYRQILVDPSQHRLQRILWRDDPSEKIKTYELVTVTYGTASASFLAIRSLRQLAVEKQTNFPVGSEIALRDFYVDDLITGANNIKDALQIQTELCDMLVKGGFHLRKWISNCSTLTKNITDESEFNTVKLDKEQSVSTLGLQWNAQHDVLTFSIPERSKAKKVTKRIILSNIAQIFDPLGLIGPMIVNAKLILQQLWQIQITWDESIPASLHTSWIKFEGQLCHLNELKIPRCVMQLENITQIELHGFSDASEQAYGACIYIRISNQQGQHSSTILCSKSRVAPLKNISMPKLELCGALLLARLMNKTATAINITSSRMCFWTDSTITLAWIKSPSRKWKTFVANRVGEIQELSNPCDWHHVRTSENPADIISRGSELETLIKTDLWWHGPAWLSQDYTEQINASNILSCDYEIPEQRCVSTHHTAQGEEFNIFKYSKFTKLTRITAYCLRLINNLRANLSPSAERTTGPLSTDELKSATNSLIKIVQSTCFPEDLFNLQQNGYINKNSKLLSLDPFLDDNGIIRVGGRLKNASIPIAQRHPIVIPKTHAFTKSLIEHEHLRHHHAGSQVVLVAIREQYWPVGGRSLVRQIIRKCVICFKNKPRSVQPFMGQLPQQRVTPSRPFSSCGVDYFGPLSIREDRKRNYKTFKAYGAIFVCFATKAVHLELATDLSTETFLGAMKRFIARRGKPRDIFSDNGTNFMGANHELRSLHEMFIRDASKTKIISTMADNNINWHFIPPRAPHFGGLWEAAVKSTKHHLRRVVGNALLTYEEMYTFLVQTEAILNSRPLLPLSNDPSDFSTLTPGHFLIGDALTSNAEPGISGICYNRLSRWQHVEHLRQHFWSRWSKEYLTQLQVRGKWKSKKDVDLQPGQVVIIREDNLPPLQWRMGRIEQIHPGSDGITRTATIRTASSSFKRPATRLCPLPLDN